MNFNKICLRFVCVISRQKVTATRLEGISCLSLVHRQSWKGRIALKQRKSFRGQEREAPQSHQHPKQSVRRDSQTWRIHQTDCQVRTCREHSRRIGMQRAHLLDCLFCSWTRDVTAASAPGSETGRICDQGRDRQDLWCDHPQD